MHTFSYFSSKVIAATNRIDILDPALLRSGRLDRKIEFPLPNEPARARILEIHSRKMTTSKDVNFEELAASHQNSGKKEWASSANVVDVVQRRIEEINERIES